jgi:hypothetical protein
MFALALDKKAMSQGKQIKNAGYKKTSIALMMFLISKLVEVCDEYIFECTIKA